MIRVVCKTVISYQTCLLLCLMILEWSMGPVCMLCLVPCPGEAGPPWGVATHSSRSCRDGGEPGLDIKCLIFYEKLNLGNCQYIERQRYLMITINNIFAGFLFHVSIARKGQNEKQVVWTEKVFRNYHLRFCQALDHGPKFSGAVMLQQ